MRDGEQASGVVLDIRDWPAGTIGVSRWTLTIRAQLPGGEQHTIKRYCDSHELRGAEPSKGDLLPLRFDPNDHTRIEIDYETFRQHLERGR